MLLPGLVQCEGERAFSEPEGGAGVAGGGAPQGGSAGRGGSGNGGRGGSPSSGSGGEDDDAGSAGTGGSSGQGNGGDSGAGGDAGASGGANGGTQAASAGEGGSGGGDPPCSDDPCLNGGSCIPSGDTFTCDCESGYFGSVCETLHFEMLLPGPSSVYGMSSDGKVIVGSIPGVSQYVPARWTKETGFVALESLDEPIDGGWARAADADGSVIVGQVELPSGGGAFRWTAALGVVPLDLGADSIAEDVSSTGAVIVGTMNGSADAHLFRWTSGTGGVDVATLGTNGEVVGTNSSGTVIVGSYQPDPGQSARAPFRWTSSSLYRIGTEPGLAIDVSDDGARTFGTFIGGSSPFVYLLTSNMSGFSYPELEGLTNVFGRAMSGNAQVFAGESSEGVWIHDEVNGTRLLEDVLVSLGADLEDWDLWDVAAVSADGKTIIGGAYRPGDRSPTGYVARL